MALTGADALALSKNQETSRLNELDAEGEARVFRAFRHFWHPVIRSEDLGEAPVQVFLCGEQLAVVRLGDAACAFNDLCAHRGTALSLGCVVDGPSGAELRCAYHGWQYGRSGQCTVIPQRPDLAGRVHARVRAYPVEERYGLVWVCLDDHPFFALPEFPEYEDPAFHHVHFPVVDWWCAAPRRVENYIDVGHFAFVHDGWLGDINRPQVSPHRVWRDGASLRMVEDAPVRQPAGYSKWEGAPAVDGMVEVSYARAVLMPLTVRLQIQSANREYVQFFHPSPMTPKSIRNFTIVARNFGTAETAFRDHAEFNMTVYEQDRPIVESQRPENLPEDLSWEMHLAGVDTYTMEYRRWLVELSAEVLRSGEVAP
jgi:vanillate O-demethylase monooxygenase subunit